MLFFTTTLLNAVQAYSLTEAKLLTPGPTHPSIPSVTAVSPTSHMLLTASEDPPLIFLQNRFSGTRPLMLQPLASQTPVVQSNFHPNRPDSFLLAFKDGTVAAYSAPSLFRACTSRDAHPQSVGGEMAVFTHLHNVSLRSLASDSESNTCPGAQGLSIGGAAFVPGHRNRAMTCGADGKCHLIDFDNKTVVRSWHVRAPATSLSIHSSKATRTVLIAVGKLDGTVSIYDIKGSLLHSAIVEPSPSEMIIDVEWIRGNCSATTYGHSSLKTVDVTDIELFTVGGSLRSKKSASSHDTRRFRSHELASADGSIDNSAEGDPSQAETICRRPSLRQDLKDRLPSTSQSYMDLFSPVKSTKPSPQKPQESPQRRSTPRPRPRISSMTFVRGRSEVAEGQNDSAGSPGAKDPPPRDSEPTEQKKVDVDDNEEGTPHKNMLAPSTSASLKTQALRGKDRNSIPQPGHFALFAPYLPSTSKGTIRRKPTGRTRDPTRRNKTSVCDRSARKSSSQRSLTGLDITTKQSDKDNIWLTAESDEGEHASPRRAPAHHRKSTMDRFLEATRMGKRASLSPAPSITHRPSVELQMSPPVAKDFRGQQGGVKIDDGRERVFERTEFSLVEPDRSSSSTPISSEPSIITLSSAELSQAIHDETVLAMQPLQPGFAQSFRGPVSVDHYLPRRSSLASPSSPLPSFVGRTALQQISGNEQREKQTSGDEHDEKTCRCCSKMRDEIQMLRNELAQLRRLVKGKDRLE